MLCMKRKHGANVADASRLIALPGRPVVESLLSWSRWWCKEQNSRSVTQISRGSGWRIHCGVEVTELRTNKQLSLSGTYEHHSSYNCPPGDTQSVS